ncbi:hypothetical protein [Hyphomicrobium sp. CS1BSMeth3]|uniref:hypothetical protein n=1 Tax=Hyphomicrobium sp. CS1BSMeth3 TaxID=1892844 RepID=UPI000931C89E|nr:hypothetical protein [Hyphomicrobium sp. CS1BSMeth3]
MRYRLVQLINGQWTTSDFSEESVVTEMEARGFAFNGLSRNAAVMTELRSRPQFLGLLGPMWGGIEDGEAVLRYEDPAANEALSN